MMEKMEKIFYRCKCGAVIINSEEEAFPEVSEYFLEHWDEDIYLGACSCGSETPRGFSSGARVKKFVSMMRGTRVVERPFSIALG